MSNLSTGVLLLMLIAIIVALSFGVKKQEEVRKQADSVDLSNCKIIGDAVDNQHSGVRLRNIYQCPDGMMYIR